VIGSNRGVAAGALGACLAVLSVAGASAQNPSVGLSTVRAQRFGFENLLGFYGPNEGDRFGFAVAIGDFNGDGADDLATSAPKDDGLLDAPIENSGSVIVRYGVPGIGLRTDLASTVLRQVPSMDPPETGDRFGDALAACDFNGDGFDDLAVGIPEESQLDREGAGALQVHYGSSSGLNFLPEGFFAQNSPGIPGDSEVGDRFGAALACGDFNGDRFGDLAVGVPWEGDESSAIPPIIFPEWDSGMAVIIPGSAIGLNALSATYLTQAVDGVGGDADYGDEFGWALAAGDFNGDGFDDLSVGVPGEDDYRGALHVFFGGPTGISTSGSLFWMEGFLGGTSEDDDHFAKALLSADFDADGFDDLAVGVPFESKLFHEEVADAGRAIVIYGSRLGFERERTQFWTEDGIVGPGESEAYEGFGSAFAVGDFDKDGFVDLVIDHAGDTAEGSPTSAVTVLMGSADGLTDARTRDFSAGVEGVPGPPVSSGRLWLGGLTAGDFDGDGHADLVVAAPGEPDAAGAPDVGAETVFYGAIFADGVDNGDASFWSATQSSSSGNRVAVTREAQRPPAKNGFGLEFVVAEGDPRGPLPSFVRVDPDRGLRNERFLRGSFFLDPQSLTMSTAAGANSFRFMSFDDGPSPFGKTRLAFNLVRTVNGYFLSAESHNQATNSLQVVGSGLVALANGTDRNLRFDFEWRAGSPGQLAVWRTAAGEFSVPDPAFQAQLFSVPLPGAGSSVVNHITAGVVSGVDQGTFGRLILDELSFRR
jgi:hypothetical protein